MPLVLGEDGQMDPQRMTELLTYTYGAKDVKIRPDGKINANLYRNSRTHSSRNGETIVQHEVAAMKSIMGVDVVPNEKFFEGKTHIQTPATNIFRGQHISMSVVATPASLDKGRSAGTARVDHYNAGIEISNHIAPIDNAELKRALIGAYSSRIDSELARINADLGTTISRENYVAMLLGKKNPGEVLM